MSFTPYADDWSCFKHTSNLFLITSQTLAKAEIRCRSRSCYVAGKIEEHTALRVPPSLEEVGSMSDYELLKLSNRAPSGQWHVEAKFQSKTYRSWCYDCSLFLKNNAGKSNCRYPGIIFGWKQAASDQPGLVTVLRLDKSHLPRVKHILHILNDYMPHKQISDPYTEGRILLAINAFKQDFFSSIFAATMLYDAP